MNTLKDTNFTNKVFSLVRKIPFGKVCTYKEIAKALGEENAVRAVGNALKKNKDFEKVKCFKVVKTSGKVGGYALGLKEKIKRLQEEDITVKNGKIDLEKYLHKF